MRGKRVAKQITSGKRPKARRAPRDRVRLAGIRFDRVNEMLKAKLTMCSGQEVLFHKDLIRQSIEQGRNIDWIKVNSSITFLQKVQRSLLEVVPVYEKALKSCNRARLNVSGPVIDRFVQLRSQIGENNGVLTQIIMLREREQN